MRIAVILNGISLRKKFFYKHVLPELKQSLSVDVFETISKNHAVDLALRAVYKKFDLIVAAGGDGTVHQVVNGMLSAGIDSSRLPLFAVLPLGSGNDFARSLNAGRDAKQFVSRILHAEVFDLDIGQVECYKDRGKHERLLRYFVNVADVGMGPEVVSKVLASGRPLGSGIAYYQAILSTFFSYVSPELSASGDGWIWKDRMRTFAVANGKYFGSGLCVAPETKLNDGKFDVFAVGNVSILDFIMQSIPLRQSRRLKHKLVHYYSANEVILQCERDLPIEADGEVCGWLPATVKVSTMRLKALKVG